MNPQVISDLFFVDKSAEGSHSRDHQRNRIGIDQREGFRQRQPRHYKLTRIGGSIPIQLRIEDKGFGAIVVLLNIEDALPWAIEKIGSQRSNGQRDGR